jgi:ketosteroid isomerase-like protein
MGKSETFLYFLFAFVLVLFGGAVSAQTMGDDEDAAAITTIWQNYAAYVEVGDGIGWLSQYDAEGIQLRPDAPSRTKEELDTQVPAAFQARVNANDVQMSVNPIEIVVTGPWAFSRGTYTQEITSKTTGQLTQVDGKFLTILKKQDDGSWKIYRDCFNSNVPPK